MKLVSLKNSIVVLVIGLVMTSCSGGNQFVSREVSEREFETENSYIFGNEIIRWNGKTKDLIIPAEINNLPVKSIAYGVFAKKNIQTVQLPDSLVFIHGPAFEGNKLTSLDLPNNLKNIGGGAFKNNKLTNLTLPENLQNVASGAFDGNPITKIEVKKKLETKQGISGLPHGFSSWYNLYERQSGIYTYSNNMWKLEGKEQPLHGIIIAEAGVEIEKIDNVDAANYLYSVEEDKKYMVSPGKHTLVLYFKKNNKRAWGATTKEIDVKAGNTYDVGVQIYGKNSHTPVETFKYTIFPRKR